MKKSLSFLVAVALVFGLFASMASAADAGLTTEQKYQQLVDSKILKGDTSGDPRLNDTLTRAEFVTIADAVNGLDTTAVATQTYSDVNKSQWWFGAVEAAAKANLVNGIGQGKFGPKLNVTVEQAIKVFVISAGLKPVDGATVDGASAWAAPYIKAAQDANFPIPSNFKANATRAQAVDLAYDAFQAISFNNVAVASYTVSDDGKTIEFVLTNGDKVTKTLDEALVANTEKEVSFTYTKGAASKTITVKVTKEVLVPAVASVSQLNAKQLQVVFNKAVNETSAETVGNYYVKLSNQSTKVALTTAQVTADLQADGKTVILTAVGTSLSAAFGVQDGSVYQFVVSGVKDTAGLTAADFTQTLANSDTTAPTFVSAAASGKTYTNTVTLTFSEPVDPATIIAKVNGAYAVPTAGSTPTTISLATGTLYAGQTYTVEILNVKDFAGNLLNPNTVTASVAVAADTTAPTLVDATVLSDKTIKLTFDKAMASTSLVANTSIKLIDGNAVPVALTNLANADSGANKVWTVDLTASPFASSNTVTYTLILTTGVTDSATNALASTSRPVTFTKDATAPVFAGARFIKANSTGATYAGVSLVNGAIVLKYSEAVATVAATFNVDSNWVVVNNSGNIVTANYITNTELANAVVNSDDKTEVVIPLHSAIASGTTSLTVRIPGGAVKDLSVTGNTAASAVPVIAVSDAVDANSDTTAPVISGVVANQVTHVITYNITEAGTIDPVSVMDTNNYRLDGVPLAAGSYVTIGAKAGNLYPVTVNLAAGSAPRSDSNYVFNVIGVKDTAGNYATTFAGLITLNDDVKPVVSSAVLNSTGTATLTTSETLATPANAADFVVTVNGSALNAAAYTLTPITVGAEAGKIEFKVNAATDGTNLYIDVNGNTTNDAGDIVLGAGTTAGTVDLKNNTLITSVTIKTTGTGAGIDAQGNHIAADSSYTLK